MATECDGLLSKTRKVKNVIITGGNGYIGINLQKYLEKRGICFFSLDPDAENICRWGSNIDFVVHLAALPGIAACKDDFENSVIKNISTAFNIFALASTCKIPVIFTSSQAAKFPHDNTYAMMKRVCEIEADRLNRSRGADIRILRLTNVYGGLEYLERKNTVVKKFLLAKRENSAIIINGEGKQIRDFIHVDDVCRAIFLCMQRKEHMIKPVDIGTGIGISILDLAKMFNHDTLTFDFKSDIVGANESIADTKRAEKLFGFKSEHLVKHFIEKETIHV